MLVGAECSSTLAEADVPSVSSWWLFTEGVIRQLRSYHPPIEIHTAKRSRKSWWYRSCDHRDDTGILCLLYKMGRAVDGYCWPISSPLVPRVAWSVVHGRDVIGSVGADPCWRSSGLFTIDRLYWEVGEIFFNASLALVRKESDSNSSLLVSHAIFARSPWFA